MTAILLAMTATIFLGGGLVLTQFGLRHIHPLSGAAISIPSFTLCFLLASPFLLHGEAIVWSAVPIFAAVGLVFPALLTLITFSSNRALGPVVTASLGNIAPLFSVLLAVVLLGEPLRLWQFAGLLTIVAGVLVITVTRTQDIRNCATGRYCCRSARRCCAASSHRSSRSASKCGQARWRPASPATSSQR